eukprot:jgi/Hompol1/2462/HPOL_006008-RA
MLATDDQSLKKLLHDHAREIGGTTLKVIESLRPGCAKPTPDAATKLKVSQAVRDLSVQIVDMNAIASQGCSGIRACDDTVTEMDSIVIEYETSGIFAQAKQLDPIDPSITFAQQKDEILAKVQALTDKVQQFKTANLVKQEELAKMAEQTLEISKALKDQTLKATSALTSTDYENQMKLLMLGKDIATSVQALVRAAGSSSGMTGSDPSVAELNNAVTHQFDAINAFVVQIMELGDDSQRFDKAVDVVMEGIDEAYRILNDNSIPALGTALPDEIVSAARQLAVSAAAVVTAAMGKQDTLVTAANDFKKRVDDLVRAGKAAVQHAPDDQQIAIINSVGSTAIACKKLISCAKTIQQTHTAESKQRLQTCAKDVTVSVTNVVNAAGKLVPDGYVDTSDPNVIAERELQTAARAIEAAAIKLESLKPVERPREANVELNFDEQILEAAKAIASATSALVRSATGAQREIIARGRTAPKEESMYFSDGTWSDGLVSAAKLVASATGDLCEAANQAVKGSVQREKVIVCARNVSSSTVQLLTAAGVRSDPTSQTQIRLRAAGKAVTDATEQLVEAGKAFGNQEDEAASAAQGNMDTSANATKAKVAEMEAQMKILRMEKELERARAGLAAVRRGKYAAGVGVSV